MELVGHGIRVNSLTPTATDPSESFERAARWGRTVRKPESLDRLMKPFRDGIPMKKLPAAERLRERRRVPRVGRFGDDHRHRPQGRRRRHRPLLGLGPKAGATL